MAKIVRTPMPAYIPPRLHGGTMNPNARPIGRNDAAALLLMARERWSPSARTAICSDLDRLASGELPGIATPSGRLTHADGEFRLTDDTV
jgi:hypothetical protein